MEGSSEPPSSHGSEKAAESCQPSSANVEHFKVSVGKSLEIRWESQFEQTLGICVSSGTQWGQSEGLETGSRRQSTWTSTE